MLGSRDLFRSGRWYHSDTSFKIVSVLASNVSPTAFTVAWDLSEVATGYVEYGTTTSYGSTTPAETSLNYFRHVQSPTGLTPGTTYHYRVRSTNAAGVEVMSDDATVTTTTDTLPGTVYYAPAPLGGSSDDTASINAFLSGLPSGTLANPTIAIFDPSNTYYLRHATDTRLHLRDKRYVYIYGCAPSAATGAVSESTSRCTIYNISPSGDWGGSCWAIGNNYGPCNDIKIIGFHVVGANSANFRTNDQFYSPKQYATGFQLYASSNQYNVEIAYNVVEFQWGHGAYVRTNDGSGAQWDNVNIHHNVIRGVGVMGIAIGNGQNIYIDDNKIYDTGLYPVDVEDAYDPSYLTNFYVRRNLIQDWGWSRTYNGPLAVTSYSFMNMTNFYIQDNTIQGAVYAIYQASTVGQRGIFEFRPGGWSATGPGWGSNFVISGNTSTVQQNGVQVLVQRVLNLTLTNNTFKGNSSAYVLSATNGSTIAANTGNTIVP